MRVLQLTVHFAPNVGGVETHLLDLVKGLAKKGWDVFVLTYRPLSADVSYKIYEKDKNTEILRLPWIQGLFYKFTTQPFLEFLYLIPGLFIVTPFVLMVKKPDVIHAHGIAASFIGILWGAIFRKRVILSTHSVYHFPQMGLYTNVVKFLFSHASHIICLSQQSAREVISLGISAKKVTTFTYWVDLELFRHMPSAKKQLGWNEDFVILFVGRLIDEKGVHELLSASSRIDKKVAIKIAGVGPLENLIKAIAKKNKAVTYVGNIPQQQLPLYYSAADVLIIPSVHEEGFGRVILEALACGTPVIAAKRGGILEAVDDSVAILIEINPQNIALAVNELKKNKKLLQKMSSNAREFAEKRYSEKNIHAIAHVYTNNI